MTVPLLAYPTPIVHKENSVSINNVQYLKQRPVRIPSIALPMKFVWTENAPAQPTLTVANKTTTVHRVKFAQAHLKYVSKAFELATTIATAKLHCGASRVCSSVWSASRARIA